MSPVKKPSVVSVDSQPSLNLEPFYSPEIVIRAECYEVAEIEKYKDDLVQRQTRLSGMKELVPIKSTDLYERPPKLIRQLTILKR